MESKDIDMTDERLLLDYARFVDEVTSEESKAPQAFSDALDIIDETSGLPPERLITAASMYCSGLHTRRYHLYEY